MWKTLNAEHQLRGHFMVYARDKFHQDGGKREEKKEKIIHILQKYIPYSRDLMGLMLEVHI